MEFCVVAQGQKEAKLLPQAEFERLMQIQYVPGLVFADGGVLETAMRRSERAVKKGWLTQKQQWLSVFYAKEIREGYLPDVTIAWIDDQIGYGVFTNRDIPPATYMGEYTGMVRRKYWRKMPQNDYCFDYAIGELLFTRSLIIDARFCGNHTRFINHSDKPNMETLALFSGGVMHIALFSLCHIAAGSQLTYDYGSGYWQKHERIKSQL